LYCFALAPHCALSVNEPRGSTDFIGHSTNYAPDD